MSTGAIVPLEMSDDALRRRIAMLAKNSANVLVSPHAKQRMRERKILLTQVLAVLQGGSVVEHAHRNIHGNWQCTLLRVVAGDRIRVAAALEMIATGETVIVVTVMN